MLLAAFVFGIGSGACASAPNTPALTSATVQLQWVHQAQFAGFYAADQKGRYAAEGLAVTFIEGGAQVDNLAPVLAGRTQFGVATAEQLIAARAKGQPLRAIAINYRRSPSVFITLAESGITRPQEFAGKKIRAPASVIATLQAMTARVGVTPDQYTVVDLPSDLTAFRSGEVPVWNAFLNTFVIQIQQAGIKINIIYPDDYGVHFYADCIFARDDFIAAHPDLVTRFLRATLQGWTYAVENPDKIGPLVQKYNPKADPNLENAKMTASLPLVNTGEDHIGWMKPGVWAAMEQTLRAQGVVTQSVDITQVYTLQFLQAIYGN
jgi:NitT/TauT family transport system substrate-binding protein